MTLQRGWFLQRGIGHLALVLACGLALSCAGAPRRVRPLPLANRLSLSTSVSDLTGTGADAGFRAAVEDLLQRDILYEIVLPQARTDPFMRKRLPDVVLRVGPNPFRPVPSGATPSLAVPVDLERAQYEPYDVVADMLHDFVLLGTLGYLLGRRADNVFVASIQYRCNLKSCGQDEPVLVSVAREGDVRTESRQILFTRLNRDAGMSYLFQLAEALADKELVEFPVQEFRARTVEKVMELLPDVPEPSSPN